MILSQTLNQCKFTDVVIAYSTNKYLD